MPDFGMLNPIAPTNKTVANLPGQQSSGDSGIGSLLSGLSGLVGSFKPQTTPSQPNQATMGGYINQGITDPSQLNSQPRMNQLVQNSGIFDSAMKEMGLKSNDPTLKTYLAKANPNLDPNVTPWCAGFVGSVLNANGMQGTGSLAAKSYLKYGTPINQPSKGDIVVFNDLTGNNDPNHGHVGFVDHIDPRTGQVITLGGNQSGQVGLKAYPLQAVAGFRHPPTGQQVQQFAAQNNIQNPQQLSNVTKNMNNTITPQSIVESAKKAYPNNPAMAQLAASQAILESGVGNGQPSALAAKHNNLFGIKGHGTAGYAYMPTTEYINGRPVKVTSPFAANNSLDDSFKQYDNLINNGTKDNPNRYKSVREAKTFEDAANAIAKSGYATDPKYTKQLQEINKKFVQPLMNTSMNNAPIDPYTHPEQVNPPQMPHELFDKLIQEMDQGSDYASNPIQQNSIG